MKWSDITIKKIWYYFSQVAGVIGLVSTADNLVAWPNFIDDVVSVYRMIVYFPCAFIPIELTNLDKDYFFVGSLVYASLRVAIRSETNYKIDWTWWITYFSSLMIIWLWPVILLMLSIPYFPKIWNKFYLIRWGNDPLMMQNVDFSQFNQKPFNSPFSQPFTRTVIRWFGSILLTFLFVLIIALAFKKFSNI